MKIIALLFAALLVSPALADSDIPFRVRNVEHLPAMVTLGPGGRIQGPFEARNDKGEVILRVEAGHEVSNGAIPHFCLDASNNFISCTGGN